MGGGETELSGPDLATGVSIDEIPEGGSLLGHCEGEPVLLARQGDDLFAVGASCTHYGGPLADGLVAGTTVHCPWHHARFCLRTGRAVGPPALDPVDTWSVEREEGDRVRVTGKRQPPAPEPLDGPDLPERVVIVGAGAAGNCAAETLRNEGFQGSIVLVGAEPVTPTDRPNLSKSYLAGDAPEEWMPLRDQRFYEDRNIDLQLGRRVTAIDADERRLALDDGSSLEYDALLLTTGAEPKVLPIEGAGRPFVYTLRTLSDSDAIIAAAEEGQRAVVIGAGFIGLEVAGSLRARDLDVAVVAPESQPLEHVMGEALGAFVRQLHEDHGVSFYLGHTLDRFDQGVVVLDDGRSLECDLVVLGVGVRPADALAKGAGLSDEDEDGIEVDAHLQTRVPGIFAAGDVARWPDPRSGQRVRIEHWVVAQRMGQTAARNILGRGEAFDAVPFFWSRHYDVSIHFVGHAPEWDRIDTVGDVTSGDCALAYRRSDRTLAVATVGRGLDAIRAELALEAGDEAALRELIPES